MIYDSIVIGGGPGGLSAALGLARQNRTCLVISHKVFRNDGIEASHAVLGHDHIHPQTIWARAREQLVRYGTVSYAQGQVISAQKIKIPQWNNHEGVFVKTKDGQSWTGKTLVLAAGVRDLLPNLVGYRENWPRNIYQCLFCDGWERRQYQKAILCLSDLSMHEAKMASMALGMDEERKEDGSAKVTVLTNGPWDGTKTDPALEKQIRALVARGVKIDQRKVVKFESAEPEEGVYVHVQDGTSGAEERVFFGFIVSKPPTTVNIPDLIAELGVETDKGMFGDYIKTAAPFQSTNVTGVFAAGDSGSQMTHVTTAMSSGVMAAGGIVHYLNEIADEDALAERSRDTAVIDGKGGEAVVCEV